MKIETGKLSTEYCRKVMGDFYHTQVITTLFVSMDTDIDRPVLHISTIPGFDIDSSEAFVVYEDEADTSNR